MGFKGCNVNIADVTESDTAKHTVDISAYVPENCVAIIVQGQRISGTGSLHTYSNEGSLPTYINTVFYQPTIAILNQRIQYRLTVANDDFDIYMLGYWTAGQVMG